MGFTRYVALGDSFTEGVGDPAPERPNGLRGWADLVAGELAAAAEANAHDFHYANLAIRGRLLEGIIDEQVDAAIAMTPDLVTIYGGGNDLMRPSVDIDAMMDRYETALAKLAATGATVVAFTAYDAGWAPVFRMMRGRAAIYNEQLRAIADRHEGIVLLDYWRLRGYDDYRMWDTDRLHMSSLGHTRMAAEVLDRLGVDHAIAPDDLPPPPRLSRSQEIRRDAEWVRTFLAPWVMRRVRGTSSGDGITPRHPVPTPVPTSGVPVPARAGL